MLKLNVFGEDAKFEHIGIAVGSIKESAGGKLEIFDEETQKVRVAFVKINGIDIELIEPLGADSPVTTGLKKGQRLLHICFKVADLKDAIKKAKGHGFHCIAEPVPAQAFEGKKIAWLFSRTYGLIEWIGER